MAERQWLGYDADPHASLAAALESFSIPRSEHQELGVEVLPDSDAPEKARYEVSEDGGHERWVESLTEARAIVATLEGEGKVWVWVPVQYPMPVIEIPAWSRTPGGGSA